MRRGQVPGNEGEPSFGPYAVGELLGTGGMASVHRAEERGRRRVVALKRLLPMMSEDPDVVQSFVREARLAMALHHPNIAETYDAGVIDGTHYIAMELVSGPTLAQVMKQCDVAGVGAIPLGVVLAMVAQVCDALDYAHNLADANGRPLGLVHRDISPVNIIVSNRGAVKLIDFGLVKIRASAEGQTAAGMIKGKFAYLAPEYMHGQLDHRADLFGLGAIAHELLTGRRLFHARTDLETISNITELPIQPPSRWAREVTRDVDDIVLTALQRDPLLRWQSAKAMGAAIGAAMRNGNVTTGPTELLKWVEWAFTQVPKPEDSHLVRVIDMLEEGTTDARVLSEEQLAELHAVGAATPTTGVRRVEAEAPDDKATTAHRSIRLADPAKPVPRLAETVAPDDGETAAHRSIRPGDPRLAETVAPDDGETAEHRSIRPGDPRLAVTIVPPDGGVAHKPNPFADTLAAPSRGPSSVRTLPLGHAVIPPRKTAPQIKATPAPPEHASQQPAPATDPAEAKRPQAPERDRGWILWVVVIVVMACAGAGAAYAVFVM